jgi:hypothetical protein
MATYRIYFVGTARTGPGKGDAAGQWWRERGKAFIVENPSGEAFAAVP